MLYGKKLLAIIPAFNEEGKIGTVVRSLRNSPIDYTLVVDDGSTDSTRSEALEAGALVLSHEQNLGSGAAIRTAVEYARKIDFDVVVFMAGDGQTDPDDIIQFVKTIVDDRAQFVQGSRFLGDVSKMPRVRRFGNIVLTNFFRIMIGANITDYTCGYRAYTKSALYSLIMPAHNFNRYEMEPWMLSQAVTFLNWREVPIRCIYGDDTSKMNVAIDWRRFIIPILKFLLAKRQMERLIQDKTAIDVR